MRTANPAKRQFSTLVLACLDQGGKTLTITKDQAIKALELAGGVPTRLSTYLWNAEKAGFGIESIKEGRTVTHLKLAGVPQGFDAKAFAEAHRANPATAEAPADKPKADKPKLTVVPSTPKTRVGAGMVPPSVAIVRKPGVAVRKAVAAKLTSRKANAKPTQKARKRA